MADPTPDGFSDSDQAWFEALQGAPLSATHPEASIEGEALRRALELDRLAAEADPRIAAALAPAERERRRQQMHARLRRIAPTEARPERRRWAFAGMALAAAVVAGVVLVPIFEGDADIGEPPTMRGEAQLLSRVDARPRQAAKALTAALRAAGLQPGLYRRGKVYIVDVDVPFDADDGVLAALRRAGIETGVGFTRIEIAPR